MALLAMALRRRMGGARRLHLPFDSLIAKVPRPKLHEADRIRAKNDFPEVDLPLALKINKDRALPIDSAPLSELTRRRPFFEDIVRRAHATAQGDIRLLLDGIDRAIAPPPPPLSWAPPPPSQKKSKTPPKVCPERVVAELNKVWDIREEQGRGRPMTAQIVISVLKASINAPAAIHFFAWAGSERHAPFFKHTTFTYNGLVNMLVQRGFLNEAIRTYRIMFRPKFLKNGCGPNTETLGLLVRRMLSERGNHLTVAVSLLNEAIGMQEDKPKKQADPVPVLVSDDLLHDVIEYVCKIEGMLPLALRFFHRCKHPGGATYKALVRAMIRRFNFDEAYELMVSMGVNQGLPTDGVTYHTLIAEFCRRGELSKAHVLLHDFMERGEVPTVFTFNLVLEFIRDKASTSQDGAEKAQVLRDCMVSKGVPFNVVTFSTLVQVFSKGGKVDEALALLKEMLDKDMKTIDGATGKALVAALVKAGRPEVAMDLLMKVKFLKMNCPLGVEEYASVVYAFLRMGKVQDSMNAFRRLRGNRFMPDRTMYNVFIAVLCKKGRFVMAKSLLKEVCGKNILQPDASSFGPFVVNYAERGQVPEAYKMFKAILGSKLTPHLNTYSAMVKAFSKIGSMSDAAQILEHMFNHDCYPDEDVYKSVIEGLEKSGNTQARDILTGAMSQSSHGGSIVTGEHMFKAVFRLRTCIRTEKKPHKEIFDGDDDKDKLEEAQIAVEIDQDQQIFEDVPDDVPDVELVSPSSPLGIEDEEGDMGTCREILRSLVAAGVDEKRAGYYEPVSTSKKKKWTPRH